MMESKSTVTIPRQSSPDRAEVMAGRVAVQFALGLGITAAQDWCATQVHTTRRVWQQWEAGDRGMHPTFWELFRIKFALIAHTP